MSNPEQVRVVVGYLVTHADGYEARFGLDRARAELYASRNHATCEPMFIERPAESKPKGHP